MLSKGEANADKNVFAALANKILSCLHAMALSWGPVDDAEVLSSPWRKVKLSSK